mgnify:CR=1 FL=1
MNPFLEKIQLGTRRHFLRHSAAGLGGMALNSLLAQESYGANTTPNPLTLKSGHFPGKAKRVIYLHMTGSPPNLDMFDYKPKLDELHGKPMPESPR